MKILVVRFRALGDCVIAAWPVTALREALPDAEISWVVEGGYEGVIDTHHLVNRLMVFPRKQWKAKPFHLSTWRDQVRKYLSLRQYQFDFGIDLQGHSKTALALRLSGAKRRVAVQATDLLAAKLNPIPLRRGEKTHWVDHDLALLQHCGFAVRMPERPILPPRPSIAGLPPAPFVSVSTGGSYEEKRYPITKWQAVCGDLRQAGIPVVLLGGSGDASFEQPGVLNWVGRTSLVETMAVIEQSALHIATDTGTGHFAAALGTPLVSLFGSREDEFHQFHPYTQHVSYLKGQPDCRAIVASEVVQAARGRLGIL